jgi:hypoxanthine-DNA glycosylase
MPGIKSLQKQQYYAHERNAFWQLIYKIFDADFSMDYDLRAKFLLDNKIGLWDTLQYCIREGSLDSDIKHAKPNDINTLIANFPGLKNVIFNGQYAEKFYNKFHNRILNIRYLTLPSTSPANARLSFNQKLNEWSVLKDLL